MSVVVKCKITGIVCDLYMVEKGFLFVCISGYNFDGHMFAIEAVKK